MAIMADLRTKRLVSDLTREVELLYTTFGVPVAIRVLQSRFIQRVYACFGYGAGFTWLIDELAKHGILKVFITPTGKRWTVPMSAWQGLGPEDRAKTELWCQTAIDPRCLMTRQAAQKLATEGKA